MSEWIQKTSKKSRGRGGGGSGGGGRQENEVVYYGNRGAGGSNQSPGQQQQQQSQSGNNVGNRSGSQQQQSRGGFNQASGTCIQTQAMPGSVEHKAIVRRPATAASSTFSLQPHLKTFPVLANYYRIVISDIVVHHYDVAIAVFKKEMKQKGKPQQQQSKQSKQSKQQSKKQQSQAEALPAEKEAVVAADNSKADLFIKTFSTAVFTAFQAAHPGYFPGYAASDAANSSIIYDGYKQLYSVRRLPIPEQEFFQTVKIEGREQRFSIKLKHVESIDLSQAAAYFRRQVSEIPDRVFSVLEIIFRRFITDAGYTNFQRKYFDLQSGGGGSGGGGGYHHFRAFDFVRGFLCGVCQTEFGLALNVHLKATGIISKSYSRLDHLVTSLLELPPGRTLEQEMPLSAVVLRRVNENIKNLPISVTHTTLSYKVAKLVNETPESYRFEYKGDQEGASKRMVSTFEYFRLKYPQVRISPRLPMVVCTKKQTHMPLDLCRLKDVHFMSNRLLKDQEVQARLLTFSTMEPKIYFNSANQIVGRIAADRRSLAVKHEFGLEAFSMKAVRLHAHQISAPELRGANPTERFADPMKKAINFVVICFDPLVKQDKLGRFFSEMAETANTLGMKFSSDSLRRMTILKEGEVKCVDDVRAVCEKINTTGLDIAFIVFPLFLKGFRNKQGGSKTDDIYNIVKLIFDQNLGLMSQGINSKNVISWPPKGYFNNILLKVNGKTNGISTVIAESTLNSIPGLNPDTTMVVGVDVFHPGSTDQVQSSIAAAIGSYNKGFTRYSASIRVQKMENKDREMILQIDEMMVELMQHFKAQNNGRFPSAIFIFRDGVSEGQLEKLKNIELKRIEAAVKRVTGTSTTTKLSLILVQKRHHCRFALTEERSMSGGQRRTSNVPKGTVVDSMIVDPDNEEFYLASHESPQGTTKPTKYIKIRDDLYLTMPDLQKFCFFACHQCVRNRNSISIPTAIRYADLCAYRSGIHIKTMNSTYLHIKDPVERERKIISDLNKVIRVDKQLQSKLYYC